MLGRIDAINTDITTLETKITEVVGPFAWAVQQLDEIPGIGPTTAAVIIAEIGVDMTRFPTPAHLASWAGRVPLDNQSGKRKGPGKRKKGNRYLGAITGETAASAARTDTREGARYRKLARSRGKAKACVALGNTQMRVYHVLLSSPGMRYQDLGPDYYEHHRATARQVSHHVGKLSSLGYEVTLCRRPEPGTAQTQDTLTA